MMKKFTQNCKIALFLGFFVFIFVTFIHPASVRADDPMGKISNPVDTSTTSGTDGAVALINKVITLLAGISASWLLITIIWNGFKIIKADRSAEVFSEATKNIMYSILGMFVVGLSYVIAKLISLVIFGKNLLDSSNWGVLLPVPTVLAAEVGNVSGSGISGGSSIVSGDKIQWGAIIKPIITTLFGLASVACLIFIIWGGIMMITSGGDRGKMEAGRNRLAAAVLGLLVVASSFAIWYLVLKILGVSSSLNFGF